MPIASVVSGNSKKKRKPTEVKFTRIKFKTIQMKRKLSIIVLLALFTLCYAEKVKLELNLKQGETYTQKLNSKTTTLHGVVDGKEVKTVLNISGRMNYKVLKYENSIYEVEAKFDSLFVTINSNNSDYKFNSETIDEKDTISSMLKLAKEKPFQFRITNLGKVLDVENIDIDSIIYRKFPQLSEKTKQQINEKLSQIYSKRAFQASLELRFLKFPDFEVTKGKSWKVKSKLESSTAKMESSTILNVETTYELKEINEKYYLITCNSTIQTADKNAYVKLNGYDVKFDIMTIQTEEAKVDKKTGWIMYSKIGNMTFGSSEIKKNEQMPNGMTIPIANGTETTITE
jgi:hypothetical protein